MEQPQQQQQTTNEPKKQKPRKQWAFYKDHDIATEEAAGMIVIREFRPVNKWSYPDYHFAVLRIVARQVKTGRMVKTTDAEGNETEVPELESRFDAVHTGNLDYDSQRVADVDPMKMYEVTSMMRAEHAENVKSWELRRSGDRGAVTHRMKIPLSVAPMPEPRKRDREANRAKQGRQQQPAPPQPAPQQMAPAPQPQQLEPQPVQSQQQQVAEVPDLLSQFRSLLGLPAK